MNLFAMLGRDDEAMMKTVVSKSFNLEEIRKIQEYNSLRHVQRGRKKSLKIYVRVWKSCWRKSGKVKSVVNTRCEDFEGASGSCKFCDYHSAWCYSRKNSNTYDGILYSGCCIKSRKGIALRKWQKLLPRCWMDLPEVRKGYHLLL